MKKLFLILVLIIAISAKDTKAQNGVPDTLAYLQTIVDNKSNYIGQPFSVLLDSLQIQIKFFSPFASIPHDKTKETSTSFSFYLPQDGFDDFYLTYPKLKVSWQIPLNATQSDALWGANNGGGWSAAVNNFYKNAIIKDIQIRE